MQQGLALFFIVITGKVYALSLMHTINSRRAMRERFKSHDLGRTSLSQFQWSEPRTLVGSGDLPTPEVINPRSIDKPSPHLNSRSIASAAEHDRGERRAWPRATSITSHGEQCCHQLQTNDFTDTDHQRRAFSPFGDCHLPSTRRRDTRWYDRIPANTTVGSPRYLTIDRHNVCSIRHFLV